MRKIILNLAVTLDGLIEGPNGEYDWCLTDQDYGMTAFMQRIDTVLFGRKSWDLMVSVEPNPYPDKQKFVFSKTMKEESKSYVLIKEDAAEKVRNLKMEKGKDIWLFGGASLTSTFLNEGLIDELMLSVHPIILGKGKPLFQDISQRMPFTLLETKTYDSGLVQLLYHRN